MTGLGSMDRGEEIMSNTEMQQNYELLVETDWKEVLFDTCTKDWRKLWFLDGKKAVIEHSEIGMDYYAGKTFMDDSCHAVLWTKASYEGDMKIEFEYTRLDRENRCVNILYVQATGMGVEPYEKDISKWNDLREVPAMSQYFDHMHTYHISYAAFNNEDSIDPGYIRARRYMASGLDGTALTPDYEPEDFFQYGVPHKMTVIKSGDHLYLHIDNGTKTKLCHWHNTGFPCITEGRIGLRHMFTRGARYKDFRISIKKDMKVKR